MFPRLCHIGRASQAAATREALERARSLGFNGILVTADPDDNWGSALSVLGEACVSRALALYVDVDFAQWDLHAELVETHPECFAVRREGRGDVVDPRAPDRGHGCARLRPCENIAPVADWCAGRLREATSAGVAGFRAIHPGGSGIELWSALIAPIRDEANRDIAFIADTTGVPRGELAALSRCGFGFTLSSLPWWDGRANWFAEEHEALSRVAPVIAQVEAPAKLAPVSLAAREARLAVAAFSGSGILMPLDFADLRGDAGEDSALHHAIRATNAFVDAQANMHPILLKPTGAGAAVTVLMRFGGHDPTLAGEALVALVNPSASVGAVPGEETRLALREFDALRTVFGEGSAEARLPPGGARLCHAVRTSAVRQLPNDKRKSASEAATCPRVVIAEVSPCVAEGRFPARRIAGERVSVEADIFADGHPVIAAEVMWRADDERSWRHERMSAIGNDRWRAEFDPSRIGRHRFFVSAWIDVYGGFMRDLARKRDAGHDVTLDLCEGLDLVRARMKRSTGATHAALAKIADAFENLSPDRRADLLLAAETAEAVRRSDDRRFLSRSDAYVVEVERQRAAFSSWYELFPRSQTDDPSRSGTLRDVVAQLPRIAEMGFDVLYLTPIHPIGATRRKGRNNALEAAPDDPGSTYAIGSPEGGHESIHPELGTREDFRALVEAAHEHGIEIALDFAIQCSRDHPWLKEHKGWFSWRPDGSIHFAENPPKKYEDIVNIDFYGPEAVPEVWTALRDVVLHWIDAGVRIFRVDNPHTKPFPFWEWMIADVRALHPNTIFLSEAFTRPKVMYRLAQLGFSQSYTYFIWRNSKRELTDYMTELARPPVSDFFRPHFFVNTPDINPWFLQKSGRAGFLIRAALAATLSGLWGMYSGYELCECDPLPGREEYNNSEKYEIRPRNWNAPGNIAAEIATLNRLRKAEPALQTHLGLTFYNAFNEQVLYFGKSAPGHRDRILVAVSLDPHQPQETDFEIPLWEWGLSDDRALECDDLLRGTRAVWHGKLQRLRLTPEAPYAIWRVRPAREQ